MTRAVFHPEAVAELLDQALFYDRASPGLGERFVAQVEAAVRLMESMPSIGSPYRHGTRRVFPKDSPHSVVYQERPDGWIILAIAPHRRKPGCWRERK